MMSTETAAPNDPAASTGASASALGLPELSPLEFFVLAGLAVHAVLPSEPFAFPIVSHTATLFLLAPLGLLCLVRAAWYRNTAAMVLLGFLLSATISGLFARSPIYSIRGDVSSWMTVAATAAAAGWWALGRRLGDGARAILPWTLVAVMSLNALVGVLQVSVDRQVGLLASVADRAQGFLDNPVYYGSVWAGAAAWVVARGAKPPLGLWTLGVLGAGFATGLSGSRAATVAVVLAALVVTVVHRTLPAVVNVVAVAFGIWVSSAFGRAQTSSGTLDRITTNTGVGFRVDLWKAALEAMPRRPLFGHGFNHFSTAIDGELTMAFLRANQSSDVANPTLAPHNFAVLLLISVGIVGTAVFACWLVAALSGTIDIALLIAAGAIAATWMLQPASSHSFPVAMLLLGAAIRPSPASTSSDGRSWSASASVVDAGIPRGMLAAGALAGLFVSAYVLIGMNRFDASDDADQMASIAALFPDDGQVALAVSLEYEAGAARGDLERTPAVLEAIAWAEVAADVAPSAQGHTRIARLNLALGDLPAARTALDRAIDLQYWNPSARQLLVSYAREVGDDELLAETLADACLLDLPVCVEPEDG